MKSKILFLFLIIIMISSLLLPQTAIHGAQMGLTLWFNRLLPTLLPFLIISNILMDGYEQWLDNRGRTNGWYRWMPLIVTPCLGWLMGLPIGAILTNKFYEKKMISKRNAYLMLIACNQLGPMFLLGYVYNEPKERTLGMVSLILPQLLLMLCCLILWSKQAVSSIEDSTEGKTTKKSTSRFHLSFQIIDAGIMNGFAIITRLGGYIILFCVLQALISHIPCLTGYLQALIIAGLEITSGITLLKEQLMPPFTRLLLITMMAGFGGICTHAQTYGIIHTTNLSGRIYTLGKLGCALLSGVFLCIGYSLLKN